MAGLQLQALTPSPVQTLPSEATPPSRTTTSLFDKAAIVGEAIEMSTNIEGSIHHSCGGNGEDHSLQEDLQRQRHPSVTESYSHEKLLSSAITQAMGGDNPQGDQQVLTQTLVSALSVVGKFLLVLDDVWSNRPWTDILQSPVVEAGTKQPGSRVIITTRKEDLVEGMGATYHLHHVKRLSDEDAWTLLKKQLLPLQVQTMVRSSHCCISSSFFYLRKKIHQ
jgi:hypothetical protein